MIWNWKNHRDYSDDDSSDYVPLELVHYEDLFSEIVNEKVFQQSEKINHYQMILKKVMKPTINAKQQCFIKTRTKINSWTADQR